MIKKRLISEVNISSLNHSIYLYSETEEIDHLIFKAEEFFKKLEEIKT